MLTRFHFNILLLNQTFKVSLTDTEQLKNVMKMYTDFSQYLYKKNSINL